MKIEKVDVATPTRLMVIQGGNATCHYGITQVAEWSTENDQHPFDAEYYRQVAPLIYDEEWAASMAEQGRVFPLLDQPGDVEKNIFDAKWKTACMPCTLLTSNKAGETPPA